MNRVLLVMFCSLCSLVYPVAQSPIEESGISVLDDYESMNGYYVFYNQNISEKIVVFIHGYGALNPAIYGNWILHLVEDGGYTVIYPRYQKSIFNPATEDFPETISEGILSAIDTIQKISPSADRKYFYAGHSYGGAATAFFASEYDEYNLPKPAGVFCAQPGTSFFKGMVLDSYENIAEDIPVIMISAEDDVVVGDRICRLVHKTMTSGNKRHVHHYPDRSADSFLHADHHSPYDINMRLDNDIFNMTTTRAIHDTQHDVEDTHIYQFLLDQLLQEKSLDEFVPVGMWNFAQWPDGEKVKPAVVN